MDMQQDLIVSQKYANNINMYYTKIMSHAITADGKYLLATIKSGVLAVFPLKSYLKNIYQQNSLYQDGQLNGHNHRLNKPIAFIPISNALSLNLDSIKHSRYKFIVGGEGSIKGHTLTIDSNVECGNDWTINLSCDSTFANAVSLSKDSIFVGCSDNNIYSYDKETLKLVNKLSGHQDYINCLKYIDCQSSLLYSGSEDGSVRVWDMRSSDKSISIILPFKNNSIERPHYGKWIGALDISPNNEWLICGGGPSLSMWHLRSNTCVKTFDFTGVSNVAQFLPDDSSRMLSAGSLNQVNYWKMSESTPDTQLKSSIDNIYSIAHHNYVDFNYDLYCFAGDSFKLEICKNSNYIDCELTVS